MLLGELAVCKAFLIWTQSKPVVVFIIIYRWRSEGVIFRPRTVFRKKQPVFPPSSFLNIRRKKSLENL